MQTALIMMTILGCDDAVSQCDYIDSPRERWVSVELCHAASERLLNGFTNAGYPTVIAVCQQPEPAPVTAEATPQAQTPAPAAEAGTASDDAQTNENKGLAARALDTVRLAIPGREKVRMVFEAPLHVISDSYSWVARKVGQ